MFDRSNKGYLLRNKKIDSLALQYIKINMAISGYICE